MLQLDWISVASGWTYCLLCEEGARVERGAAPPDADGLRGLARRCGAMAEPVRAVIESMNGARFVHDTLEQLGWEVRSPTRRRSRAWRRWRARPTGSTRGCWPSSRAAIWCRRSGCPIRGSAPSASARAGGCTWCAHRSLLKNRIHATLLAFGHALPGV